MGLSEIWFLDLWLFVGLIFTGLALLIVLVGLVMVAFEGRKGWANTTEGATLIFVFGWTWPLLLAALPFIAIYRAVRNV